MTDTKENYAREQAESQLESIIELMDALNNAETTDEKDAATEAIDEKPLCVDVRSGWGNPGELQAEEYRILLCTGGPAVQITGDLGMYGQPHTVKLQYQDWFTPWYDYPVTEEQEAALMAFAERFYYGD